MPDDVPFVDLPIDDDPDLLAAEADGPCDAEDFIATVDDVYRDFMPTDAGGRVADLDNPFRDFMPDSEGETA